LPIKIVPLFITSQNQIKEMNLNREIAPDTEEIKSFSMVEASETFLTNNIPVYSINTAENEVLRLEFTFDAGSYHQSKKCQAYLAALMLNEGTQSKSAKKISDELDFWGSYFDAKSGNDDAKLTLYCLRKHLDKCIPIIADVLSNSIFPQHELETHKQNSIQKLSVLEEKNSFLARRYFLAEIFEEQHPYGAFARAEDYSSISRENLLEFYGSSYKNNLKYLTLAGAADTAAIELLNQHFGLVVGNNAARDFEGNFKLNPAETKGMKKFISKKDSVQSAIYIGRKLFNRNHPDYRGMQLLNLVLGGFFGSRLMKNIREEKGLTYGIHSSLESLKHGGSFYISTEINNELRETGLTEIYSEIKDLRENLIGNEELTTAKSYILGSFLRSIDGPFALMDRYKTLKDYGLNYDYYYTFVDVINGFSASALRDLANKYLQEENLVELVVGE